MSPSEPTRNVRVTSEDGAVWITILDREFVPKAAGPGKIETALAPGLYAARFEAGSSVRDQLFSLEPGTETYQVHEDKIAFATPTPLPDTRSEQPKQTQAARRLSRKPRRSLGRGGELLIFARDADHRARTIPTYGLTLHGPEGEEVHVERDSARGGRSSSGSVPPWAGCNYVLHPGTWRLQAPSPAGASIEQAVVVCDGWQTQVYLQRGPSRLGRARSADLANAAVLMTAVGHGFDPEDDDVRAAELARQGLRDRRAAIAQRDLQNLLSGKARNPMLGIYGAHLLLHEDQPNKKLIRDVVRKLHASVGEHPDVRALELWLTGRVDGNFSEPPMLKSSWSIIIEATATNPRLVPAGSRSAAITPRVLSGGPWLRWRSVDASGRTIAAPTLTQDSLGEALADVAAALPDDAREVVEKASSLDPAESSVISLAWEAGDHAADISDVDVLKSLRMPRLVAEDAVGSVIEYLDAEA